MPNSTFEITLHMADPDDFFVAPEYQPLKQKAVYEAGVDSVYTQVKARRVRDDAHLTLFFPGPKITPDLEGKIKDALADYCRFQANQIQYDLNLQRRLGHRTLWVGLSILVISLILSALGGYIMTIATSTFMIGLGGFMFNGFMIIGWVSLWTPTAMLLFDWWPDWVSKRTYERMAEMPLSIRPEPEAAVR